MKKEQVQERILHPANGYLMLLLGILLLIAGIGGGVAGSVIGGMEENGALSRHQRYRLCYPGHCRCDPVVRAEGAEPATKLMC